MAHGSRRVLSVFLLLFCFALGSVLADTLLFSQDNWIVDGAADTGTNPPPVNMRVSVEGKPVGRYSELKIHHEIGGLGAPQVFSVKGNGAMRAVLPPPGEFGGTFYATGYWDCDAGFLQGMRFLKLDIRLDPKDPGILRIRGKASNQDSLRAPNFTIRVLPVTSAFFSARASYKLIATRDLCVDFNRQMLHEGFRVARIASNYLSGATHDSDQARYVNSEQVKFCAGLLNQNGFIFANPLPMGQARLFLVHRDDEPRATPTLRIRFGMPAPAQITPQGYVTQSVNPNDDNVDLWGNWDSVAASYTRGAAVGKFLYDLEASAPMPLSCDSKS